MSLLQLDDVNVQLGGRPILQNIDLVVPAGGLVTVLGRNGVGKTTLLRTISGLYKPSAGKLNFGGEVINGWKPHKVVRFGISHAPEGRQMFADLSVLENLRAGALHLSEGDFNNRFEHVTSLFPIIKERETQMAGSLSGGEQQMLCIGRALMSSPRLLLLDEPSLGLAPKIVAQIFKLIETVRAEGVSVLLVEQNARLALSVADYAYVLDQGQVVLQGAGKELIADERVTSAYLGSVPDKG